MGFNLDAKHRRWLDETLGAGAGGFPVPASVSQSGASNFLSNVFFPKLAPVGNSGYITPGSGLNFNASGGFGRDANGALVELPPATNSGTLTAPGTAGQSVYYAISFDPAALAYVVTAGTAAATAAAVPPAFPAGQIALATIRIQNGDVSFPQSRIDNLTFRTVY
jgi:hypothetical protein